MQSKERGGAARESGTGKGWLSRLRRDSRGNTLAIVGAALVPLAGMIGSGVDMSRAYMAKTRLQSACDAAALAGRRIMTDDQLNATVTNEATRFFNFNFPQGLYSTAAFTPAVTRPTSGTVRVTASTTIPTSIMRLFGFTTLPLNVTCDASLNFVNTDVMLVLDLSTSMNDPLSGSTRIVALRDAVMALYDELAPIQAQLEANGLRLRYGAVNYSNTVNVGRLIRDASPNYLLNSADYQSRVANYTTEVYVPTDTPITAPQAGLVVNPGVQRFQTSGTNREISNANCTNFGNNNGFTQSGTSPVGGTFTATGVNNDADVYDPDGSAGLQASAPAAPTGYVRYQFSRNSATWSSGNKVCDRNVTVTRRSYTTRYSFTNWTYRQANYDTSQYKASGGTVTIASNTGGSVAVSGAYTVQQLPTVASNVTTTPSTTNLTTTTATGWNGCIEERRTVNSIDASSNFTIPSGAYDLNINLIPHNDDTRWRPMWPQIAYYRANGTGPQTSGTSVGADTAVGAACPTEARRLQAWTRANMLSYVNSLTPNGHTYHDIGMLWGARLISSTGIFADSPTTHNGMPVTRHIIFMTDGVMQTGPTAYTHYGIEQNDRRTFSPSGTPTRDTMDPRHIQRFRMICNAAKGQDVSIWVIAFGTSLTSQLIECASSPNQASTSTNRDQLIARFREIGNNIGALRLTQ